MADTTSIPEQTTMEDLFFGQSTEFQPISVPDNNTVTGLSGGHMLIILPLDYVDYIELSFLTCMGIIGAFGNGLIVLVQVRNTEVMSTDILVANMAAYDFFDSTVNTLITTFNTGLRQIVVSTAFCQTLNFCVYWTAMNSAMFIGSIALDRYFLTCRPLSSFYTRNITIGVCVFIPIFSIFIAIPPAMALGIHPLMFLCGWDEVGETILNVINKIIVTVVLLIFVITAVSYFQIALLLRKRVKQRMKKSRRRVAINTSSNMSGTGSELNNSSVTNESANDSTTMSTLSGDLTKPTEVNTNMVQITVQPQDGDSSGQLDYGNDQAAPTSNSTTENERNNKNASTVAFETQHAQHDETKLGEPELGDAGDSGPKPSIQKSNRKSTKKAPAIPADLRRKEQMMTRTTIVLFVITLVYIVSWSTSSVLLITNFNIDWTLSRLLYLVRRLNIVTNPALFICLSSKFREAAKKICACQKR